MRRPRLFLLVATALGAGLITTLLPAMASAAATDLLICKDVGPGAGVFSSADCQTMGGGDEYAWTKMVAGEKIVITGGPVILKGKIAGVSAEIECASDSTTGTGNVLEEGGAAKATLTISSCTVKSPEPTKCTATVGNLQLKAQAVIGSGPELDLSPSGGTTFTEITLANKTGQTCTPKGTYAAKGTQSCKAPKGEESLVKHTIECTATGSALELAGSAATFTATDTIELVSGAHWEYE